MARQVSTSHRRRASSFLDLVEASASVNYQLRYSFCDFSIDDEIVDIVSVYTATFAILLSVRGETHPWTTDLVAKQFRKVNHIVIELDDLGPKEILDKLESVAYSVSDRIVR